MSSWVSNMGVGFQAHYYFQHLKLTHKEVKELMLGHQTKDKGLYIDIFYDLSHCNYRESNGQRMISAPEEEILAYMEMIKKEPVYRISINPDNTIQTTCYEMLDAFKPQLKNHYESVDELPKWVQDKLSVLMLLDHNVTNNEVKTVGRRISEDIFWVFHGENDGDNTRGEGQEGSQEGT